LSSDGRVLVVGSYPPVPLPAAEATLAAVRSQWDAGREVTTVSHRSGAADLAVPVVGILAGHRLDSVRRFTGVSRLVLVVEDGAPVRGRLPLLQWLCAREVSRALRRFRHVELVLAGDTQVSPAALGQLRRAADAVVEYQVASGSPPGVTVTGPTEHVGVARVRGLGARAARGVLGPKAGIVRATAAGLARRCSGALSAAVKRL